MAKPGAGTRATIKSDTAGPMKARVTNDSRDEEGNADAAALQRQRELFRAITEYGRDLVVILDGEGNVSYVSPTGARLVGSSPEEIGGRHFAEFVLDEDLSIARTAIEKAMKAPNATSTFTIRARKVTGEVFH